MNTSIAVSRETHKRLAKACDKSKTYDTFINELLDAHYALMTLGSDRRTNTEDE